MNEHQTDLALAAGCALERRIYDMAKDGMSVQEIGEALTPHWRVTRAGERPFYDTHVMRVAHAVVARVEREQADGS